TEMPIGNITTAVAVFETHIDIKPVAIIKPKMRRYGEVPTIFTTYSAKRRCRFQRCRPRASKNPPVKRTVVEEAEEPPTLANSATPAMGKITMGSNAVAANGMASVIHQAPMRTVVAATIRKD